MSNSIVNWSLTFTAPPAMLTGVIPKSRCFNENLPVYRPFSIFARTETGFLTPCNESIPSTLTNPPFKLLFCVRGFKRDFWETTGIQDFRSQHALLDLLSFIR
jgi:hypothetical protein